LFVVHSTKKAQIVRGFPYVEISTVDPYTYSIYSNDQFIYKKLKFHIFLYKEIPAKPELFFSTVYSYTVL
jgi:hypothetical protein